MDGSLRRCVLKQVPEDNEAIIRTVELVMSEDCRKDESAVIFVYTISMTNSIIGFNLFNNTYSISSHRNGHCEHTVLHFETETTSTRLSL
jgi:hypothetical protein